MPYEDLPIKCLIDNTLVILVYLDDIVVSTYDTTKKPRRLK